MLVRPFSFSTLRLLLVLVLGGTLLSACDREAINARQQSGVWDIKRVSAISYDTLGAVVSSTAETDAGQVAFINISGQVGSDDAESRFYLDKTIPSRQLAGVMGNGGSIGASGTLITEWLVDQHERRRVTLRPFTDDPFLALTTFVFTITDETDDTQHWQFVQGDPNGDHVMFREEWDVKRVQ